MDWTQWKQDNLQTWLYPKDKRWNKKKKKSTGKSMKHEHLSHSPVHYLGVLKLLKIMTLKDKFIYLTIVLTAISLKIVFDCKGLTTETKHKV